MIAIRIYICCICTSERKIEIHTQKRDLTLFNIPNSNFSVYLNFQEMDMNASYQKYCRQQIRTLNEMFIMCTHIYKLWALR